MTKYSKKDFLVLIIFYMCGFCRTEVRSFLSCLHSNVLWQLRTIDRYGSNLHVSIDEEQSKTYVNV